MNMLEAQCWKKDKELPSVTTLLFLLACDDIEYNSSGNNPKVIQNWKCTATLRMRV
jgi:hypothetical protein